MRATLGFLEKMTLRPEALTREDAQVVRDAGVGEDELRDAIHVAALFNMIVRVADALGFEPPDAAYLEQGAPRMLAGGYALP